MIYKNKNKEKVTLAISENGPMKMWLMTGRGTWSELSAFVNSVSVK